MRTDHISTRIIYLALLGMKLRYGKVLMGRVGHADIREIEWHVLKVLKNGNYFPEEGRECFYQCEDWREQFRTEVRVVIQSIPRFYD
jgi:hypothetical protein